MKKIAIYFVIILLISGCSASWHIKRAEWKEPELFNKKVDTVINITKRDTTIYLDTLISVILPRDTVFIDTFLKKLKPYSFKPIYAKNGIINVKASMTKGVLNLSSYLDSALLYQFNDSIRIKNAIISNLTEVTSEQDIIIRSQKTLIEGLKSNFKWILIAVVVIFLLGIGFKFYKWIKK